LERRALSTVSRPPRLTQLAILVLRVDWQFKRLCTLLSDVLAFVELWFACFATFHAALRAKVKIFGLVSRADSFRGFLAHLTWLLAALFLAQLRNPQTGLLNVLRFEHGTVCSNNQTRFSGQNACFHVFQAFKNLFAKLFSTYFHVVFLSLRPNETLADT
jgi:hypothetical protein